MGSWSSRSEDKRGTPWSGRDALGDWSSGRSILTPVSKRERKCLRSFRDCRGGRLRKPGSSFHRGDWDPLSALHSSQRTRESIEEARLPWGGECCGRWARGASHGTLYSAICLQKGSSEGSRREGLLSCLDCGWVAARGAQGAKPAESDWTCNCHSVNGAARTFHCWSELPWERVTWKWVFFAVFQKRKTFRLDSLCRHSLVSFLISARLLLFMI